MGWFRGLSGNEVCGHYHQTECNAGTGIVCFEDAIALVAGSFGASRDCVVRVQRHELGLVQRTGLDRLVTLPGFQVPPAVNENANASFHLGAEPSCALGRYGEVDLDALATLSSLVIDEAPAVAASQGFVNSSLRTPPGSISATQTEILQDSCLCCRLLLPLIAGEGP